MGRNVSLLIFRDEKFWMREGEVFQSLGTGTVLSGFFGFLVVLLPFNYFNGCEKGKITEMSEF